MTSQQGKTTNTDSYLNPQLPFFSQLLLPNHGKVLKRLEKSGLLGDPGGKRQANGLGPQANPWLWTQSCSPARGPPGPEPTLRCIPPGPGGRPGGGRRVGPGTQFQLSSLPRRKWNPEWNSRGHPPPPIPYLKGWGSP